MYEELKKKLDRWERTVANEESENLLQAIEAIENLESKCERAKAKMKSLKKS